MMERSLISAKCPARVFVCRAQCGANRPAPQGLHRSRCAPRIQLAVTMPDNHAGSRRRNHARSSQRIAGLRINKAGGVAF